MHACRWSFSCAPRGRFRRPTSPEFLDPNHLKDLLNQLVDIQNKDLIRHGTFPFTYSLISQTYTVSKLGRSKETNPNKVVGSQLLRRLYLCTESITIFLLFFYLWKELIKILLFFGFYFLEIVLHLTIPIDLLLIF